MLPKLRIILAAVFATCAAVLALSAGMLGVRDPGDDLTGVPEISRTLVRQAIVAEPDREQIQLLAYSRRADELLRLRDLPVTPARAVIDFAEQAKARAAETASTAATAAISPADTVTGPPAASDSAPAADAPAVPAAASAAGATPPTDALASATIAMAPVTDPHGDTTAAIPMQPASPPPVATAPVAAPSDVATAPAPDQAPPDTAAPAASGDPQIAAVQPGASATDEMYGPEKPKTDAKPRHRAKVAHPHPSKPKKKIQVLVGNPRAAPTTSTGFAVTEPNNRNAVNQPNSRNNAFGGWRNDSTAR